MFGYSHLYIVCLRCMLVIGLTGSTDLQEPRETDGASFIEKDFLNYFIKMKNAQLLKAYDLIRELQEVDTLLNRHRHLSDDTFMTDQYVALKDKLFARLLTMLAKPGMASSTSYQLIGQLVERHYEPGSPALPLSDEWAELHRLALSA